MLTGQNPNSSKCLSKLTCFCVSSFCSLCCPPGAPFALVQHISWSFHNPCHCSRYFHCLITPITSVWAILIYLLIPSWTISAITPHFLTILCCPHHRVLSIDLWPHCVEIKKHICMSALVVNFHKCIRIRNWDLFLFLQGLELYLTQSRASIIII